MAEGVGPENGVTGSEGLDEALDEALGELLGDLLGDLLGELLGELLGDLLGVRLDPALRSAGVSEDSVHAATRRRRKPAATVLMTW